MIAHLREAGHQVFDVGAHTLNSGDDYPDFVIPLAEAVAAERVDRGVAVCGSGVGASVCANKIPGIAERHVRRLRKVAALEAKNPPPVSRGGEK